MDNTSLKSHSAAAAGEKGGRAILQLIVTAPTREEMVTGHWNTPQNNSIPHNSVIGSHHYPASFHLSTGRFSSNAEQNHDGGFLNVYKFILINQSHWVFAFASCLLSIVVSAVLLKLLIDSSWRATRVTNSQLYLKSRQPLHWLLLQVLFTAEVKNESDVGAKMSQKWQAIYLMTNKWYFKSGGKDDPVVHFYALNLITCSR